MSFGTTLTVIAAARFEVKRGSTNVQLASDVKVRSSRTVDRLNTRAGPIDTYRWKVEELEFTAALTELLLTQIQTDDNISSTMLMTSNTWNVVGTDLSGAAGTADAFSAALYDYEELGPENGLTLVRVKLRVLGNSS
jgi:hypothetical protein